MLVAGPLPGLRFWAGGPVLRIDALPSHRQISDSSTIPAFWAYEVT